MDRTIAKGSSSPSIPSGRPKSIPGRLHHTARVVRDHRVTRQFYEDVLGMPLVATWTEAEPFEDFGGGKELVHYCHAFYGLADGSSLAFFQFADPKAYDAFHAQQLSGFNHLALHVTRELQDQLVERLNMAGHDVTKIEHGYFRSIYVMDPDGLYLEFTSDPAHVAEINDWQVKGARQTLEKWLGGDLSTNTIRSMPGAA